MRSTTEEAVSLALLGISVIRIKPGSKLPLEAWTPFTRRPRTPVEARSEITPDMNIAIATGLVSGLVAVDSDSPQAERWALRNLPRSAMMTRTPRGGLHIYFACPRDGMEVRNGVRLKGMALDVRADRGYILCPTSKDADKTEYRWVNGPPSRAMLEHLPRFDPDWVHTTFQRPGPAQRSFHGGVTRKRARAYIARIVAESGKGGHKDTFRATCKLRDFGLAPAEALQELIEWNRTNALPAWSIEELLHKVESVFGERPEVKSHRAAQRSATTADLFVD